MHGFLASSIGVSSAGVTCAAALALPSTLPAAAAAPMGLPAPSAQTAAAPAVSGSTRSLRLVPLTRDRVHGVAPEQGLYRRVVRHFSLVGVVWDNPDTELRGLVQVRTRDAGDGAWSGWQDVETHNEDHGADPGTAERTSGRVRGATAPLWVGDSDGVEVRVRADAEVVAGTGRDGAAAGRPPLPSGLRLELVDPGTGPSPVGRPAAGPRADSPETDVPPGELARADNLGDIAASAVNTDLALTRLGAAEIPALNRRDTEIELLALRSGELTQAQSAKPYIGPRPRIVTRHGWGADESLRERGFVYTKKIKAAFVHHSASGNKYTCSQAPSVIRSIYRYHVKSMGWRDIGYNFLVDKCGKIYEGRAGGAAKAVMGAHTRGFNTNTMGIAVLGSFGSTKPASAAVKAIAKLTAWKLGLYGVNPRGKTYLTSGGGNLYPKGKNVRLNVISGHRDGFATECPGKQLYSKLGTARSDAARYQGR
ncbi:MULTISPECIES: peptidoglycan recognition protein family protein [Streptomyces]|uniref:peptidoglycan recognition protein family protein n=1 Tax=Streptomyces herbicida TaxID=3065675 RepID=UPI002930736E|nr:peptidoglycan recognition protein [Streptomyces sp. NEAU-HV9]